MTSGTMRLRAELPSPSTPNLEFELDTLHHTPYTPHPTPYTLHPTTHTLRHTTVTLCGSLRAGDRCLSIDSAGVDAIGDDEVER